MDKLKGKNEELLVWVPIHFTTHLQYKVLIILVNNKNCGTLWCGITSCPSGREKM